MSDRTEVTVKADELKAAWVACNKLVACSIVSHSLSIVRNAGALKKEAMVVSDAMDALNAKYSENDDNGNKVILGSKVDEYRNAKQEIASKDVEVSIFLIPESIIADYGVPTDAIWLPMLQSEEDAEEGAD